MIGDNADNWFGGSAGDDHILGMGRNDAINAQEGNDFIDGVEGWDTAIYEFEGWGITANLQFGTVTDS